MSGALRQFSARQKDSAVVLPAIGDAFMGGFYAGIIDPSQVPYDSAEFYDDVAPPRYALIVGPAALESATGQTWSASTAAVAGTRTWWDGLRASQAMITASASLGTWLANLRTSDPVPADDGSDWYVPSLGELSLIYQHLKPDTGANYTGALTARDFPADGNWPDWGPYGDSTYYNPTSEPTLLSLNESGGYSSANPAQTAVVAFQLGGAQALDFDANSYYWSSTECSNDRARAITFRGSLAGRQTINGKVNPDVRARPVRRLEL